MNQEERQSYYLSLLHQEMAPALGCTEPAAAALAAAYAAKALGERACEAEVLVSQYILKNAMNVGIPGTGMCGLDIAAAMGLVSARPEKELMVLDGVDDAGKQEAKELAEKKKIRIDLYETSEKIYIEVRARSLSHTACAVLSGSHKNLVLLKRDEEILYEKTAVLEEKDQGGIGEESYPVTLREIVAFIREVPVKRLDFLKETLRINGEIAAEGIHGKYGLEVGKNLLHGEQNRLIGTDTANYAAAMTAAAADARMAGCEMPVMSAAGSGNQGLTATIPIAAVGERLGIEEEKILKAAALSILLTVHTKHYLGRLSVLCGCSISAAMGVGCGILFMLDGTYEQMCQTISTMVADISGVVCDGAKPGCALKIATAVDSAVKAANMALNGSGAGDRDGIVCRDVEKTLANLGILGNRGMVQANPTILQMMLQKQNG